MRMLMSSVLLLGCWSLCSDAAPDREAIRSAIDRGAKYLKDPSLAKSYLAQQRLGYVAVIGLALLESEIPPSDPTVEAITAFVRDQSLKKIETYDMSLALMYLDRLGDPIDVPIIQYLGVRLMAGQTGSGLWTYTWGPPVSPVEAEQLRKLLIGETELKARDSKRGMDKSAPKKIVPITIDPDKKEPEKPEEKVVKLHPEVKKILDREERERRNGAPLNNQPNGEVSTGGDPSNTQFAIIALWCSRKHGVPVDLVLLRTEDYFRKIQNPDGGWAYTRGGASTAAMTCPGLISLAMGHGLKKPPKGKEREAEFDPNLDLWMKNGLLRLGQFMGGQGNPRGGLQGGLSEVLNTNYYFFWGLERTGLIYGIDTMNNVDWFSWGCDILLKSQGQNGAWSGGTYHSATTDLDTAFALLFLNRANLAKDLSANLRGRVRDPGATTLRGGKDLQAILGKGTSNEGDTETAPPRQAIEVRPTEPRTAPANDPYEKQVLELSTSLINATPATRKEILTKLRDSKGGVYTDALGRATRRLEGEPLKEARDALASRLSRMTANTLKELMQHQNREIRRAAVLACAMKEEKSHVPDLIERLIDPDPVVNRAARAALKSLTNQDFGPDSDATPAEVVKAMAAWKEWWEMQK